MKKIFFITPALLFMSCSQNEQVRQAYEQQSDSLKTVIGSLEKSLNDAQAAMKWNHVINWFEIPVKDMEKAKQFYETILGIQMQTHADTAMGGYEMAFFADMTDTTRVSGALVKSNMSSPSAKGTIVYFNGGDDISDELGRIESAGGKVVMPKTGIGENNEHGFMAIFIDTEGNSVALHSMK